MNRQTAWRHGRDLAGIVLGSAVMAAAIRYFITGCGFVPGGVTGVASVVNRLSGFSMGGGVFILSSLILVAGLIFLGRERFAKTLFCIAAYSGFIEVAGRLAPPFTGSPWVAAVAGGLGVGLGIGLILRCRGSLGTTDLIAQILNQRFGLRVSRTILIMDVVPMVAGAILFGGKTLLYSVVYLTVLTQIIGLLQRKAGSAGNGEAG